MPVTRSAGMPWSSPGTSRSTSRVALDVLADRGLRHVLCEGGPTLFSAALAAGVVHEAAFSVVPTLVGGDGIRVTHGALLGAPDGIRLTPRLLVEEAGTLLGLWRVPR